MGITVFFFLEQGTTRQKFQFDTPGIYSIGRGEDCSLTIPKKQDNSLSRLHCQIILTASEVFLRDAGSSNGTYVNDKAVQDGSRFLDSHDLNETDIKLNDGDTVRLGNCIFQIKLFDGDPSDQEEIPTLTTTEKGTIILPAIQG